MRNKHGCRESSSLRLRAGPPAHRLSPSLRQCRAEEAAAAVAGAPSPQPSSFLRRVASPATLARGLSFPPSTMGRGVAGPITWEPPSRMGPPRSFAVGPAAPNGSTLCRGSARESLPRSGALPGAIQAPLPCPALAPRWAQLLPLPCAGGTPGRSLRSPGWGCLLGTVTSPEALPRGVGTVGRLLIMSFLFGKMTYWKHQQSVYSLNKCLPAPNGTTPLAPPHPKSL